MALCGLALAGCKSPSKLPPRGLRFRPDLERAAPPNRAPHGFARYDGEPRYVRDGGVSAVLVHVPGRFETCLRRFQNARGDTVLVAGVVHEALPAYYTRLSGQLLAYDIVLYEDAQGAYEGLKDPNLPGEAPPPPLVSERVLFSPSKPEGWRRADLDWSALAAHLKEVGIDPEAGLRDDFNVPGAQPPSADEVLHLRALALIGLNAGLRIPEPPPRELYRLTAQGFLESKPARVPTEDYALIYRRHDAVMAALDAALAEPGVSSVAILYGAAHGFDLESRLLDKGFEAVHEEWLTAWTVTPDVPERGWFDWMY